MQETPISAERIEQLANSLQQDHQSLARLRDALDRLLREPGYNTWFDAGRLLKTSYKIPDELAGALDEFGLAKAGLLQCQVHRVLDEIFITDLPSLDRKIAAYPYTSESEDIHELLTDNALYGWPDTVCDLFCGCGHHTIAGAASLWPKETRRIGFDINERALSYARINALLNKANALVSRHNVCDALPQELIGTQGRKVLFLANAPFLPAPLANVLPPTMDGGETGGFLTIEAMKATREFWRQTGLHVKGIFLSATVGTGPGGDWEIVLNAEKMFSKSNIRFKLLTEKKFIKVGGINSVSVPATIDQIGRKADCNLDVSDDTREEVRKGYANLAETLRLRGWSYIGYGAVIVDLPMAASGGR